MTFKNLSIFSACLCFVLALVWVCAPQLLLATWAVPFSYAAGLVGRRGGALFAGIGLMFHNARNTPPGEARNAIARGFGFICLALACLGTGEFASGHAGWGILAAALGELGLSALFAYVLWIRPEPTPAL